MKHRIDPKIDCVFKALLGAEENRNLLVHFLNAILAADLSAPITEVEILNPYNDKEFVGDKLSVVDVKARDREGRVYQVEIQLLARRHLPERMVYTWCDIVCQQLQDGQDYKQLRPVYSIWLLAENLLPGEEHAHEYRLLDRQGRPLADLGAIHLLELKKFTAERVETEAERWLKFFKDGGRLDDAALPDWMNTQEMRQAMNTLKLFSEKERDYFAYQARQDFLREQSCIARDMEEALQGRAQAQREAEEAKHEAEEAKHEAEEAKRAAEDAKRAAEETKREAEETKREAEKIRREAAAAKQAAAAEIERLKAQLAQTRQTP